MNFINDEIEINFAVPTVIQDMIDLAEEADKNNDLGSYIAYADNLDTVAKNCCADGAITQRQWGILCRRYTQE